MLIKTTVRLTPLLSLALDVAWEYQVGRLVIFPNLAEGKWKGEILHSTKPAKGQLSGICSLWGQGVLPHLEERTGLNERLGGVRGIHTTVPTKQVSSFSWPLPSVAASIKPKQLFFSTASWNSKWFYVYSLFIFHIAFISPELSSVSGCHPRALSNQNITKRRTFLRNIHTGVS